MSVPTPGTSRPRLRNNSSDSASDEQPETRSLDRSTVFALSWSPWLCDHGRSIPENSSCEKRQQQLLVRSGGTISFRFLNATYDSWFVFGPHAIVPAASTPFLWPLARRREHTLASGRQHNRELSTVENLLHIRVQPKRASKPS